jgi:curli biogenesis system outer membrane secretion channel CsgG
MINKFRSGRRAASLTTVLLLSTFMMGCVSTPMQKVAPGEVPVVIGPAWRDNVTPMEGVLACYGDQLAATRRTPVVIAIGDVKDYTGKYSINEGNAITQGGSLMVYSALGKLGGAVRVAERFDPSIAERELGYTDRRQLGDGEDHRLGGPNGGQSVPWLPYFGGSIQQSDYFIIGGITEVNYDINSAGAEIGVHQVGVKRRTYSQSVSIDLRIVNTKTLMVVKTVSLTKQFNGYEVGAGVFRFFGSNLFDINIGAKGQEPLQLGIRTALEEGVIRLVSSVTDVDYRQCMAQRLAGRIDTTPAEAMRQLPNPPVRPALTSVGALPAESGAMNDLQRSDLGASGKGLQLPFEFGSAELGGSALALLDRIAEQAKRGGIDVMLVSRDTENLDPGKRDALTNQRIAAIIAALSTRGIAAGAIHISWQPDPTDTSIRRDGPGMQEIAKIRVGG